jgi:hypothetical protein
MQLFARGRILKPALRVRDETMSRYCLVWLLSAAAAHAAEMPRYRAQFSADMQQATVDVCLTQPHATLSFSADSDWAMRFVHDLKRSGGGQLDAGEGSWQAENWRAGECLSYRADLGAIADSHDQDVGWRIGADIVTAPQLWLLRPDAQNEAGADIHVALPEGWNISVPWHETARDGKTIRFHIPETPPNWSAAVAFTHAAEERIGLPGGELRLTILDGADAQQRTKLRDWLAHVSRAVLSAYGRLPLPDVQVLMIPVNRTGMAQRAVAAIAPRAVHFGQSIRGEGNALELLIDPSRPAAEFDASWIAVHELSHLMHPYLGDRGAWLSEGLATYYQNVLRARSGLLTPTQAWDRLREGFMDNDGKQYDTTLERGSAAMGRTHDFQRVYWSGAAYWLTVDRDLRRDSGGKLSMELALSRFRDCCLPAHAGWRPEEFVARLDKLLGVATFSERYREFAEMRQFPDWRKVYADLGIRAGADGHLELLAEAPDAAVRDALIAHDATHN